MAPSIPITEGFTVYGVLIEVGRLIDRLKQKMCNSVVTETSEN